MRIVELALAAAAIWATGAAAQDVEIATQSGPPPFITVTAEGKVERAPDVADISAGVVTEAGTAAAAMQANADRMSAVVAAVRRAGVADRDVQTSGLSLQPRYVYRENQPPLLSGYTASNTVSLRLRRLPEVGRVVDALVAQGANQINGPAFGLGEPDAALDQARIDAMRKARAAAEIYARAANVRAGRVIGISEQEGMPPPRPVPMMARAAMAEAKDSTPVEPGQIALTVRVTVSYAID